jgi:hypothetical protein
MPEPQRSRSGQIEIMGHHRCAVTPISPSTPPDTPDKITDAEGVLGWVQAPGSEYRGNLAQTLRVRCQTAKSPSLPPLLVMLPSMPPSRGYANGGANIPSGASR